MNIALPKALGDVPISLIVVVSALAIFGVAFLVWFVVPGIRHWFLLRRVLKRLRSSQDRTPELLRAIFAVDVRLAHLWGEYEETLHPQLEERDGVSVVVAVRSTITAESFFNSQYVVDSRLRTEFFKHLPGLFTGVGIIGTFLGLIGGLSRFHPAFASTDGSQQPSADALSQGVNALLDEVSKAFIVSASAIVAAMAVTLIEKLLVSALYRLTEEIAQNVDARFGAGAGEEYLARIVHASEDSASQAKILKDALVNELRDLLREVTSAQIAASREDNRVLASAISGSIAESLERPLRDIAGTVKVASGDQSTKASQMLQDVLASFSQQLNDLFGGQISGLSDLNRDTAQGVRDVVQSLTGLVANVESANSRSTDAMAARMADAVEKLERRQQGLNDETGRFVEQLRHLILESQTETNRKMQHALTTLGEQVDGMVASMRTANEQALDVNRRREEELTERSTVAVATMTGSVDGAVRELAAASVRMQDAVASIARVTDSALNKMNYGADRLSSASSSFAQAGERGSSAMNQTAAVAGKLTELTATMTTSAAALQRTVADYGAQREAVASLVAQLSTVVDAARREASLTTDVLSRIESATEKLAAAQQQADLYLQGVSAVLGEAHQTFADTTTRTLERANSDFHKKLSSAVALLATSIRELEMTLAAKA
jgi:hypothetical protein